jgi:hypothetical protein
MMEIYRKKLDDLKRELVSFRGHGSRNREIKSPKKAFTNDEIKTLIKLILLGTRKLFFTQKNEKIEASYGGVNIIAELPKIGERFFVTD